MIEITDQPIDTSQILSSIEDEECGATVLFLGMTRRWTGGIETVLLEYESYVEMAKAKMFELAQTASQRWPVKKIAMVHRIGRVPLKEPSVAIAVSTPHRAEAFLAGQWLIDELKRQVPIWKKEWFAEQSPKWIHPTIP